MVTTGSFKKGKKSFPKKMAMKKSRLTRLPAFSAKSMKAELKGIDLAATGFALTSAGACFQIQGIPIEGSGPDDRTGRNIRMNSLEVRGFIHLDATNAAGRAQTLARIMLIYDRQPNGAAPAITDVLQDSTGATSTFVGLNLNNKDRFIVLRDRQVLLPQLGVAGVPPGTVTNANELNLDKTYNIHEYIKLSGLEQTFKASAGAVADLSTGGLFIAALIGVTDGWRIEYASRLRYYDA